MSIKKRKLLASLQKEVREKDRNVEIKTEINESIMEPIVKIETESDDETKTAPSYQMIKSEIPEESQLISQTINEAFLIDYNIHNCDTCGNCFSNAMNLKRHINIVHEGQKDFKCDTCGRLFSQKSKLKRHVHTVHEGHKNHN